MKALCLGLAALLLLLTLGVAYAGRRRCNPWPIAALAAVLCLLAML